MEHFRAVQIDVPIRHSSLWGMVVFTATSAALIFVHALIFVQQGQQAKVLISQMHSFLRECCLDLLES